MIWRFVTFDFYVYQKSELKVVPARHFLEVFITRGGGPFSTPKFALPLEINCFF
jgi:hypothetical protein